MGFDVGQVVAAGISVGFGLSDQKQQRDLDEKLAGMSLETQKEIAIALEKTKTQAEKQKLAFQILVSENENKLKKDLEQDKYKSFTILGVGFIVLAAAIIVLKFKK